MVDLIIRNGSIIDGSGKPGYQSDVIVEGSSILDIGHFPDARADMVIEAADRIICPGFIDVHSHSELEMLAGRHTAGVQMGVTTEFTGADGFSFAPLPRQLLDEYRAYTFPVYGDADVGWDWKNLDEYLNSFKDKILNNVAFQAPHGLIRLAGMGWSSELATTEALKNMGRLTNEFMEMGAVGINTGLDYVPTSHSDLGELIELSRIVSEYGGVYSVHLRGYGDHEREGSIAETLKIAEEARLGVHISHFFGDENIYANMDAAHARGIDITFDAYCYSAGCTSLAFILPRTLMDCSVDEFIERLKTPEVRLLAVETANQYFPEGSKAYFASLKLSKNKWMEGKTVRDIWADSSISLVDFICDLLIEEELSPLLVYPWSGSSQENEKKLHSTLTHPLQMYITDGVYVGSSPHPRGWGTYPRVLGRFVRKKKWLTLEDAIRRMTGFPASRFGLKDRGLVKTGLAADLVVFDPLQVSDMATFEEPRRSPVGIEYVFVNGVPVVKNGKLTGDKPGQILRRG